MCTPFQPVLPPKAQAERSFHVFYELLAGLDPAEREQLSLQGPETYHFLNQVREAFEEEEEPEGGWPRAPSPAVPPQGRACWLQGKEDGQDFTGLARALQLLGLHPEELAGVWAMLAAILHLGNICFCSSEVGPGSWGLPGTARARTSIPQPRV